MSADGERLWWGKPNNARRYHIFEGEGNLCESLCGNWAMSHSPYNDDFDAGEDHFREGDDCKACSREGGLSVDDV